MAETEFMIPGFIDCHTHAPQITNLGLGLTKPLLEWLNEHTFKAEKLYEDTDKATVVYNKLVKALITNGTTTCSYFSSIHLDSSKILAKTIHNLKQRAFVGKVNLTNNSPADYCEDPNKSLEDTVKFIEYVKVELKDSLVTPVVTPRFALGCGFELLKSLSKIAKQNNLPIQTHLSENKEEIKLTLDMHYPIKSYTQIYNEAGLLNKKTILAHCVHLDEEEIELIKEHECGIAHCPNSNIMLMSGILNTKQLISKYKETVKIGLGTDMSAGTSLSILDSIRMAIMSSKILSIINEEPDHCRNVLNIKEAFYMATLGGARVLNIDNVVGNFVVGKELDSLIVGVNPNSNFDNLGSTFESLFESFIINGDETRIKKVFVKGNPIYTRKND